jgi:hypothetical protein
MEMHEREQARARALRRQAEQAIPERFDRWPVIRERALALRAAASGRQPARWRARLTGGVGPALVTGALVVALLAMFSLRPGGQSASAHDILFHAQLTAGSGAVGSASAVNYHLTGVQRFGPGVTLPEWASGAQTADVERWHAADGAQREEHIFRDADGRELLRQGSLRNATGAWAFYVMNGQGANADWSMGVNMPPVSASPPPGAEAKATAVMADKLATPPADAPATPPNTEATAESVLGAVPQASPPADPDPADLSVPFWTLGDVSNAASFSDLLTQLAQQGCGRAERQADDTVAGRAAYVISVVSDGSCPTLGASGEQLLVRVDQATFVTLGWEQRAGDGTLLGSFAATSIDYDAQFPDGLFDYSPSNTTFDCATDDSSHAVTCQPQATPPAVDGTPTP